MKTKKFFMVLVALFMGSQMAIFAQGKSGHYEVFCKEAETYYGRVYCRK